MFDLNDLIRSDCHHFSRNELLFDMVINIAIFDSLLGGKNEKYVPGYVHLNTEITLAALLSQLPRTSKCVAKSLVLLQFHNLIFYWKDAW